VISRTATVIVSVCAALAGCAEFLAPLTRQPAPWMETGAARADTESLLLYFQHLRKLSGAEIGSEYDSARQAYKRNPSDFNRVRLSMVLSVPGAAFNDEGRALELLDPVAKNSGAKLHGLALVLSTHLQEQRRLNANAQGLQQKLDALRSLERSMIERGGR